MRDRRSLRKRLQTDASVDGTEVHWFETKADFLAEMKNIMKEGDNVLVKASHGMHFPELVEALEAL